MDHLELGLFYAGAVSVPLSVKLEESNDLLFRLRARRSQGALRLQTPAAQDPPHPRRTAADRARRRVRPHCAGNGGDGLRNALKTRPRLPRKTPRGVPENRAGDLQRRLRHDHLHLRHDGRSQRRDPHAPQLYGQRRTVAHAHRHPAVLPHAHICRSTIVSPMSWDSTS